METIILVLIAIVSFVFFLIILTKYRSQVDGIKEIEVNISEALKGDARNKVMFVSNEKSIQSLSVEINKLLEKQVELEVRQNKQEESNRKMLSNISHDLKTPLTVILGYSELLLKNEGALAVESKEKVEKIESKSKDVLNIINEFFDVIKLESGDFVLDMSEIDLCELCREEVLGYYSLLEDKGFTVEVEIPDYEVRIQGDFAALKRALANLIQNAIQYGDAGKYLKIVVAKERGEPYIEVIDKGKGIVEENQAKVFERLFTLEDSRNKKYQGSGLGLTITKRLVETMNGEITLKSIPYVRTVFRIQFR